MESDDYPAIEGDLTTSWQGFNIKCNPTDRSYWVSENGINPMPGACCFTSFEQAQKGISALILARTILNGSKHDAAALGRVFWNLMQFAK